MDESQLMKGIGEAVAAARSPQEYCFLWIDWWPMCMTKSEWSGWAQALGVFVALSIPFMHWLYKKHTSKKIFLNYIYRFNESYCVAVRYISEQKLNSGGVINLSTAIGLAADNFKFIKSSEVQFKIQALNLSEYKHDKACTFFILANEIYELLCEMKKNIEIFNNKEKYSNEDVNSVDFIKSESEFKKDLLESLNKLKVKEAIEDLNSNNKLWN